MSILIKGMEMPQSCDECEFCKFDISGYDWCSVPMMNRRAKPLDEPVIKPDWCPLVEVPTPHGRLIDADVLAERCGRQAVDEWNRQTGTTWGYAYLELENDVEDAPTIIEAEGE